jgi:hypothetical protein
MVHITTIGSQGHGADFSAQRLKPIIRCASPEGKYAIKLTPLSCMKFAANEVRLQLHALAYNLANFLRTMATLEVIETWSLASLRERLYSPAEYKEKII